MVLWVNKICEDYGDCRERAQEKDRLLDCSQCDHNPDLEAVRKAIEEEEKIYAEEWQEKDQKRYALERKKRAEQKKGGMRMDKTDTKLCSKCGLTKSVGEFSPDKKSKDGRRGYCKKCTAAISAEYARKKKAGVRVLQPEPGAIRKNIETKPTLNQPLIAQAMISALNTKIREVKEIYKALEIIKAVADASIELPPWPLNLDCGQ